MSSPAPKSPADQSEKSKKYDRQIRLWGDHGQALLEGAQVCLINATGLGTEILKGVVLPGIGSFTIVDGGIVTEEDIGCNFFLDVSSVGQSRAKCSMELLQELNPDVSGDFVDENVESLLELNPDFFKTFTVVVATDLKEKVLVRLSKQLWDLNIPFVFCRSVGFFGTARLQIKEHCIVETHPDNKQTDLRIGAPFHTLQTHLDQSELNLKVPWLVVLHKFLAKWKAEHGDRVPDTYKDKCELRQLISKGMAKDEINYDEAIKAVNSCFGGGKPSTDLVAIFNDDACQKLTKESNKFWILTRSVKDFTQCDSNGWLPVPGVIPDMSANTENYINLQNVYRAKALSDADMVFRHAQRHLKDLNQSADLITVQEVQHFCREVATLAIVRGTRICDEYEHCPKVPNLADQLESPSTLMGNYVVLRAMDRFQAEHGRAPGDCHVEADTARIKAIAAKLLTEWGIATPLSDDLAHELCRYGGAEIHSVSAFLGGCVAHELIKLITRQYRPIDNTFIYNAITSETAIVQF